MSTPVIKTVYQCNETISCLFSVASPPYHHHTFNSVLPFVRFPFYGKSRVLSETRPMWTHKKTPASKKLVGVIVRHNTLFTGSDKNCGYISMSSMKTYFAYKTKTIVRLFLICVANLIQFFVPTKYFISFFSFFAQFLVQFARFRTYVARSLVLLLQDAKRICCGRTLNHVP